MYGGLDLVPLVVVAVVKVPRVLQRQFRVHMGSDLAADEPAVCGRWIGHSTDFWPFRVE